MGKKSRTVMLEDFSGGIRCDIPSHTLAENEFADIVNFDVDTPGKLTTRKGYRRISDAGIAAAPVRGIFEHIEQDGRKHVIAACDGRLWRLDERERTWREIYKEPVSTRESYGANLLSNGTFDDGMAWWTLANGGTNTTIARDTVHPRTGAGCLAILSTAPPELITDGGLEEWASTTALTNYDSTELNGASVNRSTDKRSGSYCAKIQFPMQKAISVYNSGFEIGDPPTGWELWEGDEFYRSSLQVYSGNYSGFFSGHASTGKGYIKGSAFVVSAGYTYTATVRVSPVVGTRGYLDLEWYTAGGSLISTSNIGSATEGLFKLISGSAVAPANAASARVKLRLAGSLGYGSAAARWDDVTVTETKSPPANPSAAIKQKVAKAIAVASPNDCYGVQGYARCSPISTAAWEQTRAYINAYDGTKTIALREVGSIGRQGWSLVTGTLPASSLTPGATSFRAQVGAQYLSSTLPTENVNVRWDDLSVKARPRFDSDVLHYGATIDPTIQTRYSFAIKAASTSQPYLTITVKALYCDGASVPNLLRTDTLLAPTPLTNYTVYNVVKPANDPPTGTVKVKLKFEVDGYVDLYGATAADKGYYIDDVSIQQLVTSSSSVTPLSVDERVNPTFLSFMGSCYIFGYEQNIKLVNGEAVEFVPPYPERVSCGLLHKNRLFLAGDPENPSFLYYTSYTMGGEINPDTIDPFNFLNFDPDDGDEITGIAQCGAGIVVFKNRSTHMLTGSNEDDWYQDKKSSAVGCAAHHSIARYHGAVIFLSMSPMNEGVWLYDGGVNFTLLSRRITPLVKDLVNTHRAVGIIHGERYYLFCDAGDATHSHNAQVLVYSLRNGAWTRYTGIHVGCVCLRADGTMLAGSSAGNGLVYRMFEGDTDDGMEIASHVLTADLAPHGIDREHRIRKVTVFADSGATGQQIEIAYAVDRTSFLKPAGPMSLEPSGTNRWDIGEWDEVRFEEPQWLHHTFVPAADHANLFRLKLAHTASVPATINGIGIVEWERRVRP